MQRARKKRRGKIFSLPDKRGNDTRVQKSQYVESKEYHFKMTPTIPELNCGQDMPCLLLRPYKEIMEIQTNQLFNELSSRKELSTESENLIDGLCPDCRVDIFAMKIHAHLYSLHPNAAWKQFYCNVNKRGIEMNLLLKGQITYIRSQNLKIYIQKSKICYS